VLVLFDVDATLITTARAGIFAMGHAGRERFGDRFDEHAVDYSGRLDPLIIHDLLSAHNIEPTPDAVDDFHAGYKQHLDTLLNPADGSPSPARPCPGVPELLDALDRTTGLTLGLLTGNFEDTGTIKLNAAGIDLERFDIRVWGDHSPHTPPARDHLPPIALERFHQRTGEPIDPAHVTVIGDTPHDISCALANNCRALAVATGIFDLDQLDHAHRAVPDLADTDDILNWITAPRRNTKP